MTKCVIHRNDSKNRNRRNSRNGRYNRSSRDKRNNENKGMKKCIIVRAKMHGNEAKKLIGRGVINALCLTGFFTLGRKR